MIKNKSGSILIWSVFLMILIASSFIYISAGIQNQISINDSYNNFRKFYNSKSKKADQKSNTYGTNSTMDLTYFNSFTGGLKQSESVNFSFSSSNSGVLTITSGGPLYYQVYDGSTIYDNGVVNIMTGKVISSITGNLSIKNLGGFSNFSINFGSSTGIIFPYNYYEINKTIGGNVIKTEFGKY